ncbi:MAG TPA: HD domain-containing protein, partial [Armatimonadetes bacterium]|nr:HD domain-containing protein [Armatimonadota bacterium]
MAMQNDAHIITLAGLLHDIGKFRQRALWKLERKRHSDHGAEWFSDALLNRLHILNDADRIVDIIRRHHEPNPYERDLRILQIADQLASGERIECESEERGDPHKEPLLSIFADVRLPDREPCGGDWAYDISQLQLDEVIFPKTR